MWAWWFIAEDFQAPICISVCIWSIKKGFGIVDVMSNATILFIIGAENVFFWTLEEKEDISLGIEEMGNLSGPFYLFAIENVFNRGWETHVSDLIKMACRRMVSTKYLFIIFCRPSPDLTWGFHVLRVSLTHETSMEERKTIQRVICAYNVNSHITIKNGTNHQTALASETLCRVRDFCLFSQLPPAFNATRTSRRC